MKCFTDRPRRPSAARSSRARRGTLTRAAAEAVESRLLFAAFAVNDASLVEGSTAGVPPNKAVFTVTLLQPTAGQTATVDFATTAGTAAANSDYTPVSGTLSFGPGDPATKTVEVPIVPDTAQEATETFTLNLSNPTGGATIADSSGRGTIVDDDAAVLTAGDAAVLETDGSSAVAAFTVTRSGSLLGTSSVNYATAAGSASAADFGGTSGTLTFNPGEATKTISVPIVGDGLQESNEFFSLNFSNPVNATLATPDAQATIFDDDASAFMLNNAYVLEGAAGSTANAVFTVTRAGSLTAAASVAYATVAGMTATENADYTPVTGTLNFAPGQATATFAVPVLGDDAIEGVESFTARLSNAQNASLGEFSAQGYILDDDAAPPAAPASYLYVSDLVVTEGDAGTTTATFTVNRAGPTGGTTTVDYATQGRIAVSPTDFTATSGSLTFAPGDTAKTVQVQVVGDTRKETYETFFLTLANAGGATIANAFGKGVIVDDDNLSGLFINDVRVLEGNSGTTDAVFTVTRLGETNGTAQANWDLAFGTAGSSDLVDNSGIVNFASGQATASITVQVNGDTTQEGSETFFVALSNPGNATLLDNSGTATIIDNDASVVVVEHTTVVEGNAGTTNAVFTARRFGSTAGSSFVNYATADGTATQPADYTSASGTISFSAGQTSRPVTILVQGELLREANETFFLNLSGVSNTTIAAASATGLIVDDDASPRVTGVFVDGSAWTDAFRSALVNPAGPNPLGYAVQGGAAQLATLPWSNVNKVRVRFDQNVRVDQADLSVRGTNVPAYAVSDFAYDATTFVATWTLAAPVGADRLLLTLSSAAADGVTSPAGDRLDGEWSSGTSAFPSGDGAAGGDFQFRLNALPGDADRDGAVDGGDQLQIRNRMYLSTTNPGVAPNLYTAFHDLDANGRINTTDLFLASKYRGSSLPATQPSLAAAGATAASITTTGTAFGARRVLIWAMLAR